MRRGVEMKNSGVCYIYGILYITLVVVPQPSCVDVTRWQDHHLQQPTTLGAQCSTCLRGKVSTAHSLAVIKCKIALKNTPNWVL